MQSTILFRFALFLSFLLIFCFNSPGYSQGFEQVKIRAEKVTEGVYIFYGAGGNLGVCIGEDGVFIVDTQFAPLSGKIKAEIAKLSKKPIRFVLNTHWHFDHTGGNENFATDGSVIVAHENVRNRMSTKQVMKFFKREVPASPKVALPTFTFKTNFTLHLNGQETYLFHPDNAHTDGDAIVYFKTANVIHMGDTFFNLMYPFIDLGSGGNINGMIKAGNQVLAMANGQTKIIPGHGPLTNKAGLKAYVEMLKGIRANMVQLISEKKSLEEVIAAKPTKAYDEKWGKGFMKPDSFVGILYHDLAPKKKVSKLDKVVKTEAEWKKILAPEVFYVTRKQGTERPFTGKYNNFKGKGTFQCICCKLDLFSSNNKFDSGTGWPSFWKPIEKKHIKEITDMSHGMKRVEIRCSRCDSHLGHVFEDGPAPTNLRYCINSVSLDFKENN